MENRQYTLSLKDISQLHLNNLCREIFLTFERRVGISVRTLLIILSHVLSCFINAFFVDTTIKKHNSDRIKRFWILSTLNSVIKMSARKKISKLLLNFSVCVWHVWNISHVPRDATLFYVSVIHYMLVTGKICAIWTLCHEQISQWRKTLKVPVFSALTDV
jgi:hypothetical protein